MRTRKLTAADVCEVTGYNRDQLRGVLKELPSWAVTPGERVARAFTAQDLIALSVVHTLDSVMGIRRRTIASVFPKLRTALSGPKGVGVSARLIITFSPLRVEYADEKAPAPEGVTVFLQPIFDRVDGYLGVGKHLASEAQATLGLGPGLIRSRRRRGAE
jgi:hypothetical protein